VGRHGAPLAIPVQVSFSTSVRRVLACLSRAAAVVSQTPSEPGTMLVQAFRALSANCPPGLSAHSSAPAPPVSRRVGPHHPLRHPRLASRASTTPRRAERAHLLGVNRTGGSRGCPSAVR